MKPFAKWILRGAALLCCLSLFLFCAPKADSLTYETVSGYKKSIFFARLSAINLTGDQRTDIVQVALSQVGYEEGNHAYQLQGDGNGYLNFTEYGLWFGYHDMWCAMFVAWCGNVAGIPREVIPKSAYTPNMLYHFSSNDRAFSRELVEAGGYTPMPGDIVFFKSDRNDNSVNHAGVVIGYQDGYLYAVEGNVNINPYSTDGGTVLLRSRHISDTYIAYICSPMYETDDAYRSDPLFPETSQPTDTPPQWIQPDEDTLNTPDTTSGTDSGSQSNQFNYIN